MRLENPQTLGEHLRRRRIDRGLLQREVGVQIGVSSETICGWELGRTDPDIRYLPAIHRFLRFCPFDPTWSFGERLRAAREAKGLSRREVAILLRLDPGTIWRAESTDGRVGRRSAEDLRRILPRRVEVSRKSAT